MKDKYRAVVDLDLRRSPDPDSPRYDEWLHWDAGEEFVPPAHMNIDKCLERGIVEKVVSDSVATGGQ